MRKNVLLQILFDHLYKIFPFFFEQYGYLRGFILSEKPYFGNYSISGQVSSVCARVGAEEVSKMVKNMRKSIWLTSSVVMCPSDKKI